MQSYEDIKQYIVDKKIVVNGKTISATDVFDFEKDDLKQLFENYFNFCLANLRTKCDKYKIQPSSIYFENDYSVNAKAGFSNPDYIIAINMGIIAVLFPFFTATRFIYSKKIFKRFEVIETKCDSSPEFLMFQTATQFTYYHELAHLIQKSEILKMGFVENYESKKKNKYSLEHHLLEIDADLWASHFVCYHIIEYFKKQKESFKTEKNLTSLLILSLSSIFVYFVFLLGNDFKLYFKEFLHPHPSIRICNYTASFIGRPLLLDTPILSSNL